MALVQYRVYVVWCDCVREVRKKVTDRKKPYCFIISIYKDIQNWSEPPL
jgi:hypothetical protein